MENARLIIETREALEQQTATAEILRVISGSATDLQPVFEAIVERPIKRCEADFTAVARFENGVLRLVAVSNLMPEEAVAFHSLFPRLHVCHGKGLRRMPSCKCRRCAGRPGLRPTHP